jgi:hypothetical protein
MKRQSANQKTKKMAAFITAIVLLLTVITPSCKKTENEAIPQSGIDYTSKFFNLHGEANPSVEKIFNKIKKQNDDKQFINHFVKSQGYALWDKAVVKQTQGNSNNAASASRTSTNSTEDIVFIPLSLPDSNQVHGALVCKVNGDSVSIRLIDGSRYNWYTAHPDSVGMNGEQVTLLLMQLDKLAFNHRLFKVTDSAAFGININSSSKYIKILDSSISTSPDATLSYTGHWEYYSTTIYYVTYEPDLCGCNAEPCPDGSMHEVYHSETVSGFTWVEDTNWYDPNAYGGGGGGGNNGGSGGNNNELPVDPDTGNQDFGLAQFTIEEFNTAQIITPCLTAIINEVGQGGCQSLLLKKYQSYFSSVKNDRYKIKFVENNSLVGANGNPVAGQTTVNILPNDIKEVVISLNATFLQNASKEFKATVILHEVLHSFFIIQFPNSTLIQQHSSILANEVDRLSDAVIELFPTLSKQNARALALQGMDEIEFDISTNPPSVYYQTNQWAIDHYLMDLQQARALALPFINGTSGTPC